MAVLVRMAAQPLLLFENNRKENTLKASNPSTIFRFHAAIVASALMITCCYPLAAQEIQSDCGLRIGSGPKSKIYELMVQDIQHMCATEVTVCSIPSIGGLPNLMMLSANQAELGIVQLDTLAQMADGGDENIAALQAVMPLHTNLLLILSLREGSRVGGTYMPLSGRTELFRKFSDLNGMKVAVVGSTLLLGQTLNKQTGYAMEFLVAESDDQAIKMLRTNQVQAIFTDGGWPLPSISRHTLGSGLILVEYDLPPKPPFTVAKRSYENLDAYNLPFLGIPNLLVTRPFNADGTLGKRVTALKNCILNHLDELQEGRFQAGWKDIKNPLETFGVTKFGNLASQKKLAR